MEIIWENHGVAPAYHPYDLVIRLEGPEMLTLNCYSGNLQWVPAEEEASKNERYIVDTKGLPEGEYTVKIKLYSPQASRRVLLGLSPSMMDADGFYRVGSIIVEK